MDEKTKTDFIFIFILLFVTEEPRHQSMYTSSSSSDGRSRMFGVTLGDGSNVRGGAAKQIETNNNNNYNFNYNNNNNINNDNNQIKLKLKVKSNYNTNFNSKSNTPRYQITNYDDTINKQFGNTNPANNLHTIQVHLTQNNQDQRGHQIGPRKSQHLMNTFTQRNKGNLL